MLENNNAINWIEGNDDINDSTETIFTEYDISASPNDFNIKTLFDFINSGIVKIPGFQRNYVWDIKRASKLIESIIIGIPIPQIFLYEQAKNKFIVIDGQQRYMTIYYFMKKRFPKKEKRYELRKIFDDNKGFPENALNDNEYFTDFNLQLNEQLPNRKNKLNGLNYFTFDEDIRTTFELKTIRNIIIKQNLPENDDSVIHEIFNRLNSGGVNLKPQEIRSSLYHSDFYEMLYRINVDERWRFFTPEKNPDLNMRDVEILLRGFAMLIDGDNYKPSMTKFLNQFSNKAKNYLQNNIDYLRELFFTFLETCKSHGENLFISKVGRFNISVFESIFRATCSEAFDNKNLNIKSMDRQRIEKLKSDPQFYEATQSNTASTSNVALRLKRAKEILIL